MKPDVQLFMNKAQESLSAAELLLKSSFLDFAASRAYYAMFYAAEALLLDRGLMFSSHKGVVSNFGREFAKSGEIDPAFHRTLIEAQRVRHAGDYGAGPQVSEQEAEEILEHAREFISAADAKLAAS